jgi:hypothetical protein
MLKSVVQFFFENSALIMSKPALQAAVEKLKAYIHDIELLEQQQAKKAESEIALKGETKTALINATLKVLAGITAHAAATNNTALKITADITKNELKSLRDNDLITQVHAIYETATNIAYELQTWNVTQEDINAIDTHSATFDAKDPAIKNIKARSAQATADIKAKLDEAYNFTKDTLDAMMMPVKISNPTAYGQYQNARTIINTAGGRKKGTTPGASATGK